MATKKRTSSPKLVPTLTDTEQDLLSHMEHGYQLETDSLSGNPVRHPCQDPSDVHFRGADS
jgi:hypothetical protein